MARPFGAWSLTELKAELRRRNARTTGRKADLVERLEFYERHAMPGAETTQVEFQMCLPDIGTYKDLHSGLTVPELHMDQVKLYLELRNKILDKKAVNLYENRYVNYIRCSGSPQGTFFRSEVRAEMKASVVYKVDVHISSEGVILECQCECAVGMGPHAHCKHVNCVLFGLTDYTNNKEFKVIHTCTQQLQTFHKAKRHLGSPVKAEDLKLPVSSDVDFDPRPPSLRSHSGFQSRFQSCMMNAGVFSSAPIMHIFPPANPYALNSDHDYFELSAADHYMTLNRLCEINELQAQSIEVGTQEDPCQWKEERQKRICSSSFGTVCKLTERGDGVKLAKRLVSGREFKSAATTHGKTYEPVAVQKYEELTGVKTDKCGLFVAKDKAFLASTPDRIVSESVLLEVKCPFTAKDKLITSHSVPYLEEDENGRLSLKERHDYFFQVQGQMYCVGPDVEEVHFCIYTFSDFKMVRVPRDDVFIHNMVHKLTDFHNNIHKGVLLDKFFFKEYEAHFMD